MNTDSRPKKEKLLLFLFLSLVALIVHFAMFELRYNWYLDSAGVSFLRIGYAICLLAIIALWIFFPSRALVAGVGLASYIFPPLLRGDKFAFIDWKFAALMLLSVCLLLVATEVRRRIHRVRIRD